MIKYSSIIGINVSVLIILCLGFPFSAKSQQKVASFPFIKMEHNHLYFSKIAKNFNHKKFIVRLFKIPFMNFFKLSNNNYYLFVKKIN